MKTIRTRTILASLLLATGVVMTAQAAEPEDIIKYRKGMMKATGAHMGAVNAILSGKVEYKNDLADHARALAALNRDVAGLFPKDSDFGDTNALDAVWTKTDDFKKRAGDAKARSADFVKAVATNDSARMKAAFGALNDACKACHKDYRKEEKK
jgi:cytochrome c556